MRRQSLTVFAKVLRAATEQEAVYAAAAPALRQYSSLISLHSIPNQQWSHDRTQSLHHHLSTQYCLAAEGHRLYTSGPDLTPEPRVSPGLPAVPTELDEETVASIVAGETHHDALCHIRLCSIFPLVLKLCLHDMRQSEDL